MKPCIDIPRGWQRIIKSHTVIYISPSHDELKSKEDILQYLTSPGTCKCGLKCPLHLDSLFSFDANIKSKELFNKYVHSLAPNEKTQKTSKNVKSDRFEAGVGPPVAHTCGLKSNQKENSITNSQVVSVSSDLTHKPVPLDPPHHYQFSHKNAPAPLKQKPKLIDTLNTSNGPLPPISVFCKVNSYSVHQIIQILCRSLENSKSEPPAPVSNEPNSLNLNKQPNLSRSNSRCNSPNPKYHAEKSPNKGHYNEFKQSYHRSTSVPSNVTIKPPDLHQNTGAHVPHVRSNSPLVSGTISKYDQHKVEPSHKSNVSNLAKPGKNSSPTISINQRNFKQEMLSPNISNANVNNNRTISPTTNKQNTTSEPPRNEPRKSKPKVVKKPNQMLQLIQNTPNMQAPINQVHVRPPHIAHNQMLLQQNMMAQHPMNPAMFMRVPGPGFNLPYYAQQQYLAQQQAYRHDSSHEEQERKGKTTKSKSKKTFLNPPNVKSAKQPSIIIQPDNSRVRIDNSTQPTLLVSIGDNQNINRTEVPKKSGKGTPKKLSPPNVDTNCLTSVDSILKTCSNHNPIPDIDDNRHGETFSKSNNKPTNSTKADTQHLVITTTAPNTPGYNPMVPVQYLTPVPLVQNMPVSADNSQDAQYSNQNKTKNPEKWDGVLSPSEVDAKVQQILSSPQKMEDSPSSLDKDGSPKKRKRQQSAPHMYDRYPGNPALRFQTGNSVKAMKLPSKSEMATQQGSPSPAFSPINAPNPAPMKLPPNHPNHPQHAQWQQYQAAMKAAVPNQQNYALFPSVVPTQLMNNVDVNQLNEHKNK